MTALILSFLFLTFWALFAYAGHEIGANKGRATEGLWLGLIFGFIGVIIVYVLPAIDTSRRLCLMGGPRHIYEDGDECVNCGAVRETEDA
jgi:hypothetical protein